MQFGHLIRTNATDSCSLINLSVMRWEVRRSVNAVSWETVFTLLLFLLSIHVLQIWNFPAVRNSESHWTVQAFFDELNLVIMQVRWKLASHIEKFIVAAFLPIILLQIGQLALRASVVGWFWLSIDSTQWGVTRVHWCKCIARATAPLPSRFPDCYWNRSDQQVKMSSLM